MVKNEWEFKMPISFSFKTNIYFIVYQASNLKVLHLKIVIFLL